MTEFTLADLGWSANFARQLNADDPLTPARVSSVNRADLDVLTTEGPKTVLAAEETGTYAVGDWVLISENRAEKRLERTTLIQRRAAGEAARGQLIAANVDTLAVVTSCNADFNPARLERYLAMAASSGALPLIILTKADQCEDPDSYRRDAEKLSPLVTALAINAKDPADIERLTPWCKSGQTLALVGSSGVGKTTIQNALTGITALTQDIREDDAKGRHTTTSRALRPTLAGGWLIDTPGMRELRLNDAADGIEAVFADITDLLGQCRFSDCAHDTEPGCAVQAAIADGRTTAERLARWQKLVREDTYNSESLAEAHARTRKREKLYKQGKLRSEAKRGNWPD